MDHAIVGEVAASGGAGLREDQPPPALIGEVARVPGQGDDLRGTHHRVEHAAVKRHEPQSLPAADVTDDSQHVRHQFGATNRPRVDRIFGPRRFRPALRQIAFAKRVLRQPPLADRIGQHPVHHPAPPREVLRRRGGPVEPRRERIQHVANHRWVFQGGDGPRGPLQPRESTCPIAAEWPGMLVLVQRLAQSMAEHFRLGFPGQVAGKHRQHDAESLDHRHPAFRRSACPRRRQELACVLITRHVPVDPQQRLRQPGLKVETLAIAGGGDDLRLERVSRARSAPRARAAPARVMAGAPSARACATIRSSIDSCRRVAYFTPPWRW